MIEVIRMERKSAVLTPSSLACLSHVPAINLTAGCAHECRYCYARGYLNVALAGKEYYPDVNVVGKYDGFIPEDMRPQVGMEVNVPLQRGRRSAAVREASNRLLQRRAEYDERLDQVRFEVQSTLDRARQGLQVIRLYDEKILSATHRGLEAAQSNYTSGQLDFLRLIDAERQVYAQQEMYYQAIAEYHRRLAELDRAVGGIP